MSKKASGKACFFYFSFEAVLDDVIEIILVLSLQGNVVDENQAEERIRIKDAELQHVKAARTKGRELVTHEDNLREEDLETQTEDQIRG